MDMDNLGNDVIRQAMDNIENAAQQPTGLLQDGTKAEMPRMTDNNEEANKPVIVGDVGKEETPVKDSSTAQSFAGLPIESLICGPIIAAAKGQQELTAVYVDSVMKLAYKDGKSGDETNTLDFTVNRPVAKDDGTIDTLPCKISAPLLSLVPVPAFTMDELTVDFDMEVKSTDMSQTDTKSSVQSQVNYKSWFGLSANITGSVSSDSTHKRETDSSATYKIHARAIQQPPSEGMAKLTTLFSQMMEPIPVARTNPDTKPSEE